MQSSSTLEASSTQALPQAQAGIDLLYTAGWLADRLRHVLEPFQITYQQYNVLRLLAEVSPNPMSGTDIRTKMLDKSPDVTRLCDRLEAKGLIKRRGNEYNRRQVHTTITEEGRTLLARVTPALDSAEGLAFPTLTAQESSSISALLGKLRGEKGK